MSKFTVRWKDVLKISCCFVFPAKYPPLIVPNERIMLFWSFKKTLDMTGGMWRCIQSVFFFKRTDISKFDSLLSNVLTYTHHCGTKGFILFLFLRDWERKEEVSFFVLGCTHLGAMSEPCCIREPMVNQRELRRLNWFSRTSGSSLHGWGFSHSYGLNLHTHALTLYWHSKATLFSSGYTLPSRLSASFYYNTHVPASVPFVFLFASMGLGIFWESVWKKGLVKVGFRI
jgi:hypothetical protein